MNKDGDYIHAPEASQSPDVQERLEPWGKTNVVGKPVARVDAYERLSGSAVFTQDLALPDMLHAAFVRCPHAHARVSKVDTSRAESMPGVRAVISGFSPDTDFPWYAGEKGPTSRLFDPHCRYEGEEVAAIAADNIYQARDAAQAVSVEYEILPFVSTAEEAIKDGAPAMHEGGNRFGSPSTYERGNIDKGFAEADVVLEETYQTPCQIHTTMELHGSVARWEGDHLTVWDSTQGVFAIQESLAALFRLPISNVRVVGQYMGGGFGSKLEVGKYTAAAAILARQTARPVKFFVNREDSFRCVGNRPANLMTLKAGARKDGTLTALKLTNLGAVGAYPDDASVGYLVMELYLCPNVRVEENQAYINAGKARAMRAPGFPQCAWALEQMMDALAEKISMDPVEFRLRNIPDVSQLRKNMPYTSTGLRRCLEEGARAFGWSEARSRASRNGDVMRGVGVGACQWGYEGGPPSTAIVKMFADGSLSLNMGASDIGTGTKTIMAMVVAEELGVPLEKIQIEHADTGTTPYATPSGGSKTVPSDSPAVRSAAAEVKRRLLQMAAAEFKVPVGQVALRDGQVYALSTPDKKVPFKDLAGLKQQSQIVGIGYRGPNPTDKIALPFAAHFAEVEVRPSTGEIRILRLLGAHDSGRMMNLLTYRNQVFGGMTMGIGFGTCEERVLDVGQTGKMVNANWHDYKIPTAMDVPVEMSCLPVDPHDTECNTTGTKGLGEPATIPTAAALANAIYHATGIRFTRAPVTPGRLAARLAGRRDKA